MSDSELTLALASNSLYRVAAGGGVVLGVFLLLGGFGHLQAVRPALEQAGSTSDASAFALLLPALMLLTTGLIDIALCRALWRGSAWSLNLALLSNTLATTYLMYLLAQGVPGHPIGLFLALVASFVLLLGVIRLGLVWPAAASSAEGTD